jgi:hypothetical protein
MNEFEKEVSILEEKTEWDDNFYENSKAIENLNVNLQENQSDITLEKKKVSTKRTLTGKYYEHLFQKNPIICLLIIGSILGCALSIYYLSGRWDLWWWIPLSTLFLGPIGMVIIAILLPFTPWIVYIVLRIIFEIIANA